jgi:hypothetical protein
MKYLLMMYGNQELWNSFTPQETAEAIAGQDAFNREYAATGELLGAYGLADAAAAKIVKVREGAATVTDGPYLETKEYMASFYLLDVENEERALELAAQIPFAAARSVELWPIMHEAPSNG